MEATIQPVRTGHNSDITKHGVFPSHLFVSLDCFTVHDAVQVRCAQQPERTSLGQRYVNTQHSSALCYNARLREWMSYAC